LSNSKAARRKDISDVLKNIRKEKRDLNANSRRTSSGTGPVSFGTVSTNMGVSLGFNPNIQIGTGLKVGGDVMMGPIAYNSQEKTIASGAITLTELINAGTSWTIINGEGGSADDLVTINGAVFSGQILYLQAKNQTITLKTTGNIHTNDNADVELSAFNSGAGTGGEVATLIYDDKVTGGNWVVINVGAGGGSGAGLADNNVWTGSNTFQSSVSMTGPSVIIGDSSSDLLYIDSTISQDVNFGGNDIDNLDRLNFKETSQRLDSTPTGIEYEVPSGENHEFLVNSTIIADFDGNGLTMAGSHDLNISSGDLTNGSGHNGNFTWSGTGNFSVYADDAYLYSATTWIGNYGGGDLCKIAAMVDFRDHTSSTNQTVPTQSDGYIEVKIGGLTKKLFYYS